MSNEKVNLDYAIATTVDTRKKHYLPSHGV